MFKLLKVLLFIFSFSIILSAQNFWQVVYQQPVLFNNIIVSPQGNIFCITDTLLVKSTDNGITWNPVASGFTQNSVIEANDNVILVTDFNSMLSAKSTDEGLTWTEINMHSYLIKATASSDLFIETGILAGSESYRSTDDGITWIKIGVFNSWLIDVETNSSGITLAVYKNNMPATANLLYRSTNKGDEWTLVADAPEGFENLFSTSNGYFFAFKGSRLYRSTDEGLSWHDPAGNVFIFDLKYMIEDEFSNLYLSVANPRGVMKSTDMGATWYSVNSGLTELTPYKLIIDHDKYLYVNTGWGVFRSVEPVTPVELISLNADVINSTVNLSWVTASELNNKGFELYKYKVQSIKDKEEDWQLIEFIPGSGTTTEPKIYSFKDENVKAGKYIYKLIQIDYDGTTAELKQVEVDVSAPGNFLLLQNYPNPFNPITNLKFRISNSEIVTLKVYDVLGNEVAVLVNEAKEPGEYEIEFNGNKFSSGVYFYTLRAGEFSATKKLILMK